jgi:hypothetical protein
MFNLMPFSPTNFSGYVPQTEYSMDEANGLNEPIQIQQKSTIPPLMSLSITPPPIVTTNLQQKPTISPSVIKENIEPLPFPPHAPGPIQRPNKLPCSPTTQSSTSFFHDSTLTPNTPDVLIQINHLVDRQNSIPITPSTVSNLTNTSTIINDIATPNVSWTPFSPPEWSSKYESTWPLTTQTQNPFAQRQITKDESALWSEPPINPSWLKFTSVSDTSSSNRQENDTNIPFWNPINIHGTPPNSSTPWWPKTPSDENNNDHSRWDFAR